MLPQMEHSVKRIPPNAHSLGRWQQAEKKKKAPNNYEISCEIKEV
jgi:hypothetical protein